MGVRCAWPSQVRMDAAGSVDFAKLDRLGNEMESAEDCTEDYSSVHHITLL